MAQPDACPGGTEGLKGFKNKMSNSLIDYEDIPLAMIYFTTKLFHFF